MKVKVIKKMMAYLLVGAMVISTPITASAAETSIADVYTSTEDDNGSGSGSLSASSTGSEKFNDELNKEEVQAQVIGLALDKTSLALEANGNEDLKSGRLQARVLFTDYDPEDEAMVLAADEKTKEAIDKYLRWEVLGNEDNVVGISYYTNVDGAVDHSMINVYAKNGGEVTIRAFFDINGDGFCDGDAAKEFSATATVSVKQFAKDFTWKDLSGKKFLVNWKYDLNDYIVLDPATASDNVSFYATGSNAKKVAISDNGIMTVKKAASSDKVIINATIENGKTHSIELTLDPGVQAKKVTLDKKTITLDHGTVELDSDLMATLEPKTDGGVVTDLIEWSAKPNVVSFETIGDNTGNTRKVKISVNSGVNGPVGTVTITAKATSGKKATAKVVINSTPDSIEVVEPVVSWTGKKPTVQVTPLDEEGKAIPTGKTAYQFTVSATNDTKNVKNIKINKTKGLVTFPNLLVQGSGKNKTILENDTAKVDVKVTKANGKKYTGKDVSASSTITVKQANISNITVFNTTYGKIGEKEPGKAEATSVLSKQETKATEPVAGAKYKITVGSKYQYTATAYNKDGNADSNLNDAIGWASSSAKVGTITENGLFTALKGGSTKLTASYVTVNTEKKTAKLNKKTITVKPIQKAKSLTLNKNVFVVVAGTSRAKVTINVKKQLPSGSKDTITWKRVYGDVNGNMVTSKGEPITNMNQLGDQNLGTGNKVTVEIPTDVEAGRVIKIGAYADGGAVAYAYIYVVDSKTKSVQLNKGAAKTTKETMKVGGPSIALKPMVTRADKDKTTYTPDEYVKENKGYVSDPVTYSFSKAGIASIDKDGNVTALKPGTTKLTVKTLSGKKATVTIKVTE